MNFLVIGFFEFFILGIHSLDYITGLNDPNPVNFENDFMANYRVNDGVSQTYCEAGEEETSLGGHFGEGINFAGSCFVDCYNGFKYTGLSPYHGIRFYIAEVWFFSTFGTYTANSCWSITVYNSFGKTQFGSYPALNNYFPPGQTDWCNGTHAYHGNKLLGIEIGYSQSDFMNIKMQNLSQKCPWGLRNIEYYTGYQTEADYLGNGVLSYNCWIPANISYPITGVNSTTCACPIGMWSGPNGCTVCNANCATCFLSNPCIACISGYVKDIFSGACIPNSNCESTYSNFVPTQSRGLCSCADSQYYVKANNSCIYSCNSPWDYVIMKFGGASCRFPCLPNTYYYPNKQCHTTCPWPFTPLAVSSIEWYCNGPSGYNFESQTTVYWNPITNSEQSTCTQVTLLNYENTGINLCSPCSLGQYYSSGACINCESNCECGGTNSCTNCALGMYQLSNGECVQYCNDPYSGETDQYGTLHCTIPFLTSSEAQVINSESNIAYGTAVTLSIVAHFQAASGCFASSLTVITLNKMLYYTRYIPIVDEPVNLKYFYHITLRDPSLAIAVPIPNQIKSRIIERPIPEVFSQYGITSSFFLGYWGTLNTLVYVGIVIVVMTILKKTVVGDNPKFLKVVDYILNVVKYNYLLMVFTSSFSDITLYGYLDISSETWSGLGILSTGLAVVCIFAGLTMIGYTFAIVHQSMKVRQKVAPSSCDNAQQGFLEKHKRVSFLFENFRTDSYLAHSYMLIFFIRAVVYNIFAVTMSSYPILQSFSIVMFSLGMMMIILLVKPFKTVLLMIEFTTYEVLIFICNICMLYLALTDDGPVETSDDTLYRYTTGSVIIYLFLIFSIVGIGFATINTALVIRKAIMDARSNKKEIPFTSLTPTLVLPKDLTMDLQKSHDQTSRELLGSDRSIVKTPGSKVGLLSPKEIDLTDSPETMGKISPDLHKYNLQKRVIPDPKVSSWNKIRGKWLDKRKSSVY